MLGYFLIATVLLMFCMVAQRLSRTILTAPMVFIAFGVVIAEFGFMPVEEAERTLYIVAETALVVLLFLDAAQIDQAALIKRRVWPARMLAIGLPLGFLFCAVAGWLLLPGWPLAAVALVAAILVPTDAALGLPILSDPDVPERPRLALIVEGGLNDGLALPLVLLLAAIAVPESMAPNGGWGLFFIKQVTLGPLIGGALGFVGGKVLLWAQRTGATSAIYEGIAALAMAACAYISAGMIGGNGFLAAFAAGLGFGAIMRGKCAFVYEFTEGEGQLLSWSAFFLLGAVLVPDAITHLTWPTLAFILASLFITRPLAIWISLIGSDSATETRLFFGWFGPRGLATALFALLVLEPMEHFLREEMLYLAVNTVWISALLHGLTAAPGARWYARRLKKIQAAPEKQSVEHSTEEIRVQLQDR